MFRALIGITSISLVFCFTQAYAIDSDLIVRTQSGGVRGGITEDYPEIVHFYAIPYAASTADENRFRAPQKPEQWPGVREASDVPGRACPQVVRIGDLWFYSGVEDCLIVNIFAHLNSNSLRPVIVRIHGGGMVNQSGRRGKEKEATNVDAVVVTLNYRLNIMGSFALPELAREDPHGSTGNNSIRDSLAALKWVKRNIRRFGGDPSNITIVGGSAGASLVSYLTATPLARGLFQRAFGMSPAYASGMLPTLVEPSKFLASAYSRGIQTVEEAGCADAPDRLKCMRELDPETIVRAGLARKHLLVTHDGVQETWPNIDGYVFSGQPAEEVIRAGDPKVSLIVGAAKDDGHLFNRAIETDLEFFEMLDRIFSFGVRAGKIDQSQYDSVRERYHPENFDSNPQKALDALVGDLAFNCTALTFAENVALSRRRGAKAYFYEFTHPLISRFNTPVPAWHTIDTSFWYDAFAYIRLFFQVKIRDSERAMREIMHVIFENYVHGVLPSPAFWPELQPLDEFAEDRILLQHGISSPKVATIRDGRCDFLRDIGILEQLH